MGKSTPRGVLFGPLNARALPRRCITCHRRIMYGDRCPECYRALRARQRRKRR